MKLHIPIFSSVVLAFTTAVTIPIQSNADDDLDHQQKALTIISEFADKLCKEVPIKEVEAHTELTGSAKAELKGIVSKIVGAD